MSKILLISYTTLKNEYAVDENIEDNYLLPNIVKAQDFVIRPLIGDERYNEIETQISSSTLSPENELLVKIYIQPVIAYFTLSELVYTTAYKIKNQGLNNSDEANQYRVKELIQLSEKYKIDSQTYASILKDFMCDTNIIVGEDYKFQSSVYLGNVDDIYTNDNGYYTIAHRNNKPQKKI